MLVLGTVDVEMVQDKNFEIVLEKEGGVLSVYAENLFLQLTAEILFSVLGTACQRQKDAPRVQPPMMLVRVAAVWWPSFLFLQVAEVWLSATWYPCV